MKKEDFDIIKFHEKIQIDFAEVQLRINELERGEFNRIHSSNPVYALDEMELLSKDSLKHYLLLAKLKIQFAYEFLGLNNMLEELDRELLPFKDKYGEIEYFHMVDVFYSPIATILKRHLEAITSFKEVEPQDDVYDETFKSKLLERVLSSTGKIILDREIIPSNESMVQKAVYDVLIHIFPDTIKEFSIPKVSKNYVPDIGIKSLKTAIEYKFIDNKNDVKKAIGGVYEDILGYEGTLDWNTFYAVFYMTKPFLTLEQIKAEFQDSKAPIHWKPILVIGDGERKTKK